MPSLPRGQDELSETLRRLRKIAGFSGVEAAKRIGQTQASISRFENGRFVPTPETVEALCRVYGSTTAERQRLVQLSRDLREDVRPAARVIIQRGAARMQERIGRIERTSVTMRHFHPAVVSGLLQRPDYARVIFSAGGDLSADEVRTAVDRRMARQALLTEPGRSFTFLLTEGPLRWQIGSPQLMAAQLDHIASIADQPHVRVGVIPWTTTVEVAPVAGFDLYDERVVIVGTEAGTTFLTDPDDVAPYLRLFAGLAALASYDDAALTMLRRIAADYRSLPS
ncbi:MAG TPA: helix-turn-helix transcriptional regulator [Pseudonocardiaceae bacterium]|nr:helix-turn-helix transcriptional regulator [Pseudonocardiaceae bacterium]